MNVKLLELNDGFTSISLPRFIQACDTVDTYANLPVSPDEGTMMLVLDEAKIYYYVNDTWYIVGYDMLLRPTGSTVENCIVTWTATQSQASNSTSFTIVSDQIKGPNGSASLPTYTFTNDSDTGLYYEAVYGNSFSMDGSRVAWISSTGIASKDGTAASPGFKFMNDTNSGMYRIGSDDIGFSTNSTLRFSISTTALTSTLPIYNSDGSVSAPAITFTDDINTGLYRIGSDNLGVTTNGLLSLDINSARVLVPSVLEVPNGLSTAPTIKLNNSYGIFGSTGYLNITNGTTSLASFGTNSYLNTGNWIISNGNIQSDTYCFLSDTISGLKRESDGSLSLYYQNSNKFKIDITNSRNVNSYNTIVPIGSVSVPGLSFYNNYTTGLTATSDALTISLGGIEALSITKYGVLKITNTDTSEYYTLPNDNGINKKVLVTNGEGTTAWEYVTFDNFDDGENQLMNIVTARIKDSSTVDLSQVIDTGDTYLKAEVIQGGLDHTQIQNIGSNSHAAIDSHIADNGTGDTKIHHTHTTWSYIQSMNQHVATTSDITFNKATITTVNQSGNGSTGTPTYSFISDTNTGMYNKAADNIGFTTNGTLRFDISTSAITSTLPIYNQAGTAAAPAYTFSSDPDTGIYSTSSNKIGFTAGGVQFIETYPGSLSLYYKVASTAGCYNRLYKSGNVNDGVDGYVYTGTNLGYLEHYGRSTTSSTYSRGMLFKSVTTQDWTDAATGTKMEFYTCPNDSNVVTLAMTLEQSQQVSFTVGSASLPSITFAGDLNTGIYHKGSDNVGISTGGTLRFDISTTAVTNTLPFSSDSGTFNIGTSYTTDATTTLKLFSHSDDNFSSGLNIYKAGNASDGVGGPIKSGAEIGYHSFYGKHTSSTDSLNFGRGSYVITKATQDWSPTAYGTSYAIYVTNNDSISNVVALFLDQDRTVTTYAQLKSTTGSAAVPTYSFSNDLDTGIFAGSANELCFSSGGTQAFKMLTGQILGLSQTAGAPTYSWASDTDTGIYQYGANQIGFSCGGNLGLLLTTQHIESWDGSATVPTYSFMSDTNTGMYYKAANDLGFSTDGTLRFNIDTTNITSTLPIIHPSGSVTLPSVTFVGDTNTGICADTADTIQITTGGTERIEIDATEVTIVPPTKITDTTDSTTKDTGCLILEGGIGIEKQAVVGTNLLVLGTTDATTKDTGCVIVEGGIGVEKQVVVGTNLLVLGTTDSTTKDTGCVIIEGGIGIEKQAVVGTNLLVLGTTDSTTKDTGCLIVEGGVGVEKQVCVGTNLLVLGTIDSSSKDTGCVIVEGGIGVEKKIYAGLDIITGGVIKTTAGTQEAPSITCTTDLDTGLYWGAGGNTLVFATNGIYRGYFDTTSFYNTLPIYNPDGAAATPCYTFNQDTNTGIFRVSSDVLGIATNGVQRFSISTSVITTTIPLEVNAGSASVPCYSFSGDNNTGMYSKAANDLGFSTDGTLRVNISTTAVTSTLPIYAQDGTLSAPAYTFTADVNTGMYRWGSDALALTVGGSHKFGIAADRVELLDCQAVGAYLSNGNSGATKTINWDSGNIQALTLTADCTLTFDGLYQGATYILVVTQDSSPRTITWPGTVKWPGNVAPILSSGSGKKDVFAFTCIGSYQYGSYSQNYS